jgi:hypothetical protein
MWCNLAAGDAGACSRSVAGYDAFVRIGEEPDLFSSSSTMLRAGHDMGFTTIAVDMRFTGKKLTICGALHHQLAETSQK